jgi:hypothetical protein
MEVKWENQKFRVTSSNLKKFMRKLTDDMSVRALAAIFFGVGALINLFLMCLFAHDSWGWFGISWLSFCILSWYSVLNLKSYWAGTKILVLLIYNFGDDKIQSLLEELRKEPNYEEEE